MFTILNAVFVGFLGIIYYVVSKLFQKEKIPNGLKPLPKISGYPLVGNLFSFKEPLWSYLFKAIKTHGPIFTFTLGCQDIVIISSNKYLTKTMREMGIIFSGRWQNPLIKRNTHDSGIIFKDKEWWATQRSFVLKVLRDFGLGKQRSQEIINQECSILLKEIEESCGKVISGRDLFPKAMVNVIAKLVMNMRFEREQDKFKQFVKMIGNAAQNRNSINTFISMYPIMEKLPFVVNFLLWLSEGDKRTSFVNEFMKEIIEDHRKRFSIENEGEDLIDIFLKEQHKVISENVKNHTFTEWQLIRNVFELFIAGYETTSTTLTWSMVILSKFDDIQDKMYQEIVDVIGSSRPPSTADKKDLPYTQAVMDEIFRYTTVVPLSVPHRVFENTEVDGYFIPKNSVVFPNLYACHREKEVWEKPFEFYPEHFLKKQENGELKYTPRDELVPFGIGKRQCLGEALARMEYFVFLSSILQKFKVRFEKPMDNEEFAKIARGTDGGIRAPLFSNVVFETRA